MKGIRRRGREGRLSTRRQLWIFCAVAAIALMGVSFGAVTASRSLARDQALQDAQRATTRLADLVIAPLLSGAPDPDGGSGLRDELDRAIKNRLADGYLLEITIWDSTGRVRYDNDGAQIGRLLHLPEEAQSAISGGVVSSDFTNQPEVSVKAANPGAPGFVEVYVPLHVLHQPTLAFEAYYDYGRVSSLANKILTDLLPVVLLPLIFLQLIHIPMAGSLASRVRRQRADRFELLELTLSASERERARIAADLHDGPIQDLAGVGYAFEMWVSSLPGPTAPIVRQLQAAMGRSIESLRRLMVDLYPPDLDVARLPRTLFDLAAPLRKAGVEVTLTISALPELDSDTVTALYRIAREALANVSEHSGASQVSINLGSRGKEVPDPKSGVYLRIADNGIGLEEAKLDRRAEGHIGLRLLKDRVDNLGGSLTLETGPHGGAIITTILPNRNGSACLVSGVETHIHRSKLPRYGHEVAVNQTPG